MFIDEKGRLFSKISIVDILVLIFVVCAALFVGLKFFAPAENITGSQETAYEYTFKVNDNDTVRKLGNKGTVCLPPETAMTTKHMMLLNL